MADFERHTSQATHNENLLGILSTQKIDKQYSDWYVTIAFYSAVHHFEALLFKYTKAFKLNKAKIQINHSHELLDFYSTKSEHYARKHLMLDNQDVLGKMYNAFVTLYEQSRVARYDCHNTSSYDLGASEGYLDQVKKECAKLLSPKK